MARNSEFLFKVIMVVFLLLCCLADWSFAAWTIETVDGDCDTWGNTSIALDLNLNPCISYRDFINKTLKFASWDGSSWIIQTVDNGDRVGLWASLAMHGNDGRISYYDVIPGRLKYASWDGSSWNIERVDSSDNVHSFGTSLALNFRVGGVPNISYHDYTNGSLKYASWNGSSWDIQTVDSGDKIGLWSSIALEGWSFLPRISYHDEAAGNLKYASLSGSTWTIQTVDSENDVGSFSSLALGASYFGLPGISYFDFTNGDLKYAAWNGSSWDIETVDSDGDVGYETSLAIDSNGRPRISYRQRIDNNNGMLKYAAWKGCYWDIQTVDASGNAGWCSSLALDYSDNPVISYLDGTSGDLKVARWIPDTTPTESKVDVVLVLDRSGSMSEPADASPSGRPKIEILKTAAQQFVCMMEADVGYRLGIVKFNQDVVPFPAGSDDALSPLTDLNKEMKQTLLEDIEEQGLTSIGDGLYEAMNQLTAPVNGEQRDRHILLVSDGKENQPKKILEVQTDLVSNDIAVYCLGLGYDTGLNKEKLTDLAEATCGAYDDTADDMDFRTLFNKVLGLITDEGCPIDPTRELKQGDMAIVDVNIAPVESRALITAYWEVYPDAIELELITPTGQTITPSTTNERIRYVDDPYYVFYELNFPLADDLASEWEGPWQAKVTRPDPPAAGAPETVRYNVSVFVKGGVEFDVKFDRLLGLTGDTIQLTAQLLRSEKRLIGPQIDVFGDIPLIGVGNLLHDNYVDPNELKPSQEIQGDPVGMADQKLRILNEQAGGGVLERGQAAPFQLYDDGFHGDGAPNDGLYGNSFTETKTQGSYTFRFVASKIPVSENLTTTREWTKSFYTKVRIDPEHSDISIQQTGATGDGILYDVTIVPQDRFGNYMGPGHEVTLVVTYPGGVRQVSLTDNIDGTYTTEMLLTYEEYEANAEFNVSIDGEPFTNLWDPSLLAYWTLDEAEGLVAHDSVTGYDGILHGNPVWQSTAGQVNGAIQMDGMDDYISTPFVLDPSTGPFTLLMWIRGGAEGQVVVSQEGGANWLLADSSTGTLVSELNNPWMGQPLRSDTLITDGVWHQIVLVWDDTTRMLYVDGVQVAMDEPGVLLSSGGGLYMGADKNLEGGRFWSGLIDDVRLYDRVRQP